MCRLRRALYGLKQAPRAWFAKFSSTISQHGFSASLYDLVLFFRHSDHGITLLLLYVDDMIITGDDVQGIQDLKCFLGQYFEMKDLTIFLVLKSLLPSMVTISLKPSTHLILSLERSEEHTSELQSP